jgi:hypothetical protein
MDARWELQLPFWLFTASGGYLARSRTDQIGPDGLYAALPRSASVYGSLRAGDRVVVHLALAANSLFADSFERSGPRDRAALVATVTRCDVLLGEDHEEIGIDLAFARRLTGPWNETPQVEVA